MLTSASLPHIVEQVQRKAEQIDAELAVLPEPAEGNRMLLIVERILRFENQIKSHIDGGDPQYPLKKELYQAITNLRTVLEDSRPAIDEPWEGEIIVDRTTGSKGTPLKRKVNGVDLPETPSKKPKKKATIILDSESDEPTPAQLYNGRQPNAPKTVNSPYTTRFTVAQIHDIIQGGFIGLPNQTDPKVLERMIKLSLKNWEKPLDQFLNRTERLFQRMFEAEIKENFGNWSSTQLHTRVIEVCSAFLEEAMATERKSAKRALQLELRSPTAFDQASLNAAVEKARAEIKADRRAHLIEVFLENQRTNCGSPIKPGKSISEDQLGPDPSAEEYDLLAVSPPTALLCSPSSPIF